MRRPCLYSRELPDIRVSFSPLDKRHAGPRRDRSERRPSRGHEISEITFGKHDGGHALSLQIGESVFCRDALGGREGLHRLDLDREGRRLVVESPPGIAGGRSTATQ